MNKLLKYAFIAIIMFTCIAMMANNVQATDTPTPGPGEIEDGGDDGAAGEETETTDIEWTDFSNVKFELKKDGTSSAIVEMSGVTPLDKHNYKMILNDSASNVEATEENYEKGIEMNYDSTGKVFRDGDFHDSIENAIESNKDLYVSIIERTVNDKYEYVYKVQKNNVKLEKYAEPKYSDAFHATYMVKDSTQIVMTFTHANGNSRKMQIKVGKINDTSILQKIKNQDSTGFADLLKYAKSNEGLTNQTVTSTNDSFCIEYNTNTASGVAPITVNGLQDNAYYYLYVKADDESGKWEVNEAVTLAQASVPNENWGLFFYGSSDFKWADFGTSGDTPTEPAQPGTEYPGGSLPQTGVTLTIVFATLGVFVIAIVFAKKVKKYTI